MPWFTVCRIGATVRCALSRRLSVAKTSTVYVILAIGLMLSAGRIYCQTSPDVQTGTVPYSSYDLGEFGSINLTNGNLQFKIPIASYPQRGNNLKLSFSLAYNGKALSTQWECLPPTSNTHCFWIFSGPSIIGGSAQAGFNIVDDQSVELATTNYSWTVNGTGLILYYNYSFLTPDGASHPAGMVSGTNNVQVSLDGSHFSTIAPWSTAPNASQTASNTVVDSSGVSYYVFNPGPGGVIREDADGNQILGHNPNQGQTNQFPSTGLTDTLGRFIPGQTNVSDFSGCSGPLPTSSATQWQLPGYSTPFKFCYASVNISIPYSDCGIASGDDGQTTYTATRGALQSVVLPNGKTWTFEYAASAPGDPAGTNYGDVTTIISPTGATFTYNYAMISVPAPVFIGKSCSSWVTSRAVDAADGTGPHAWTYKWGSVNYNATNETTTATNTVTDPAKEDTVHSFVGYNNTMTLLETETQFYPGSSSNTQPLKTVDTQYQYTQEIYSLYTPVTSAFPTSITTTLNNGQTSQKTISYCCSYNFDLTDGSPGSNIPLSQISYPATYGLPSDVKEYDFGASSPGPLLRETRTSYYWQTNPAYQTANFMTIPASITTYDGSGQLAQTNYTYDESSYTKISSQVSMQHGAPLAGEAGVFGHRTTTSLWNNLGSSSVSHTSWYDTGTVQQALDANTNSTTYTYDPAYYGAYITGITNALNQQTVYSWIFNTGQLYSVKDPNDVANGRPGTVYGYDVMLNLQSVNYPDGGSLTKNYNGYSLPLTVTSTRSATPDPSIITTTMYDGLGRPYQTQLSDPEGIDYTSTTYDLLGRVASTSTPYRSTSDTSYGITTYSYDALNRKLTQNQPDGSTQVWTYPGNITTSKDEAGNVWQYTSDALGNLTGVTEPTGAITSYTNDALGNVLSIKQMGVADETPRTRSFTYDSLSRLITSTNPENGTICYGQWNSGNCQNGYDANGNLLYETNANNVVLDLKYDALNRLTSRNATAAFGGWIIHNFTYDQPGFSNSIGRLTSAGEANGGNQYEYDAMGRVTQIVTATQHVGWTTSTAAYDLAGNATKLIYPDGREINQTWSSAGRLLTVSSPGTAQSAAVTYISGTSSNGGISYTAAGREQGFVLGSGIAQSSSYNNRLQICQMQVGAVLPGNQTMMNLLNNQYFHSSTPEGLCGNATGNNGNIWSIGIGSGLNQGLAQSFSYDSLNRLTSAVSADNSYNQSFNIDSFGNMLPQNNLNSPISYSIDPSTNRLLRNSTDFQYDAAGDLLSSSDADKVHAYSSDFFGRRYQIDFGNVATYIYSAEGFRSAKTLGSGAWTDYRYLGGQLISESNSDGSSTDYVYANGRKIAAIPSVDNHIHIQADAGANGGLYQFYDISEIHGYVIRPGDKLSWRQYQSSTARGGVLLTTAAGGSTSWTTVDQNGAIANEGSVTGQWDYRTIDLSSLAGSAITGMGVGLDINSTGSSSIDFADIALTSSDGTVQTVYNGQPVGMTGYASIPQMADVQQSFVNTPEPGADPSVPTHYFIQDPLGTAQLEFASAGWPVWKGEFSPFGQETDTQATLNPFKFTGKERDAESGLDYFGARYYNSTVGRFMSADWSNTAVGVPYAKLTDPQSLNLYSYVRNNPVTGVDVDGHYLANDPMWNGTSEGATNSSPCNLNQQSFCVGNLNASAELAENNYDAIVAADNARAAQQQSSSGGGGFWHHVGNLLHGHSWNYVAPTVTVTETDTVHTPVEEYTYFTDATGLVSIATKSTPIGIYSTILAGWNDRSNKGMMLLDGAGALPGFDVPLGLTGGLTGFMDYSVKHSSPGPQKVYGGSQLEQGFPVQDDGSCAAGDPTC